MELWCEIRRRVLTGKLTKQSGCREYDLHWETLEKILTHVEPPGYRRKGPRRKPKIEPFLPIIQEILSPAGRPPKSSGIRRSGFGNDREMSKDIAKRFGSVDSYVSRLLRIGAERMGTTLSAEKPTEDTAGRPESCATLPKDCRRGEKVVVGRTLSLRSRHQTPGLQHGHGQRGDPLLVCQPGSCVPNIQGVGESARKSRDLAF